jgi:hypothetical protein
MNQPGGNITGVSRMNVLTDPKRLELLHEVVPKASVIACLVNPVCGRRGHVVLRGGRRRRARLSCAFPLGAWTSSATSRARSEALPLPHRPSPVRVNLDGAVAWRRLACERARRSPRK